MAAQQPKDNKATEWGKGLTVFCINLSRRPDRWRNAKREIARMGFDQVQRFDAVDGRELNSEQLYVQTLLSPRAKNTLGKPRTDHHGIFTKGALGCYLSHVSIWEKMVKEGIPECLIFEDDILADDYRRFRALTPSMYRSPTSSSSSTRTAEEQQQEREKSLLKFYQARTRAETLSRNKGIPLTGLLYGYSDLNTFSYTDDPSLRRVYDFYGLYGYLLTRQGAELLLRQAFPIEVQLDAYIGYLCQQQPDRTILLALATPIVHHDGNVFGTDVQDICFKCMLPDDQRYYKRAIAVSVVVILLLALVAALIGWGLGYKKCMKQKCSSGPAKTTTTTTTTMRTTNAMKG